ncbi:MAG: DUF4129 domain-containing protein [bacterium]
MDSPNYDFKYKYYYPLLGLLFYYTLPVLAIVLFRQKFTNIQFNLAVMILVFVFLFEGVIRSQAALKLRLPYFVYIIEMAVFFLALYFFPLGLNMLEVVLVFILSLISWYQIIDFCRSLNCFSVDTGKIYEADSGGKISKKPYEEFGKLLDYPRIWKRIYQNFMSINIPIIIIWLISDLNLYIVLVSIRFLILEIILLALLYHDKLKLDWQVNGLEIPEETGSAWNKFVIVLLLLALLTAFILPYNYSPLPLNRIGDWLSSRFKETQFTEPDIGLQEKQQRFFTDELEKEDDSKRETSILDYIFFIMRLLLFLAILAAFFAFIIIIMNIEFSKMASIKNFFREFIRYFLYFIRTLFDQNKNIKTSLKDIKELFSYNKKVNLDTIGEFHLMEEKEGQNNSQMIIAFYKALLKLLAYKGDKKEKGQTPYEYSQFLEEKYINSSEEINLLTKLYVKTSYSQHGVQNESKKIVKALWEKIKNSLF